MDGWMVGFLGRYLSIYPRTVKRNRREEHRTGRDRMRWDNTGRIGRHNTTGQPADDSPLRYDTVRYINKQGGTERSKDRYIFKGKEQQ